MASKRRLLVDTSKQQGELQGGGAEEEVEDRRTDRDIMIEGTWREWFLLVFLKYCYVVALLFIACMVPLEIVRVIDGSIGIALAFVAILIIVPLGAVAYLRLWGNEGRLGKSGPV